MAIHTTTTRMPAGIECPDEVRTRLGTLRFFDGFPDDATVQTLFDNLDFQRAVQAYLLALPALSVTALRRALQELDPANSTMCIWEDLIHPRSIALTAKPQLDPDVAQQELVRDVPAVRSAGTVVRQDVETVRHRAAHIATANPARRENSPRRHGR